MGVALAGAYAGRTAEALREGEAAIADVRAHDATDFANMRLELSHLYLALDKRENA
jgi:hypothetical protein